MFFKIILKREKNRLMSIIKKPDIPHDFLKGYTEHIKPDEVDDIVNMFADAKNNTKEDDSFDFKKPHLEVGYLLYLVQSMKNACKGMYCIDKISQVYNASIDYVISGKDDKQLTIENTEG